MFVTLERALEIVLELAKANAAPEDHPARAEQDEAFRVVEDFIVNQLGE